MNLRLLPAARCCVARSAQLRSACNGTSQRVSFSVGSFPRRGPAPANLDVQGRSYPVDSYTNVTPTILSKVARQIHLQRAHPIAILRSLIEAHFAATEDGSLSTSSSSSSPHPKPFKAINALSPIVTVEKNFDELGFAADHPGRALSDSYYLNAAHMLRTHTSAHEVETFRAGTDRWLLTADVYRRDEIDASHYPVFHQMEGAHVVPRSEALRTFRDSNAALERRLSAANIVIDDPTSVGPSNPYQDSHDPAMAEEVTKNLKNTLNSLVLELFGGIANSNASVGASSEPLQIRWIEAFFPFTSPSYEVEVMFQGKWLEILGCGVVRQKTLDTAGVPDKIGWAFGLGLERIAMVLFGIPDIRLFWSQDARFLSQFKDAQITTFRPYSRNPPCYQDISFWVPDSSSTPLPALEEQQEGGAKAAGGNADQAAPAATVPFHENDFCEIVRDVAGDLAEETKLIDSFTHPKTGRKSLCYRITYRSMDKNVTTEEARSLTDEVQRLATEKLGIEVR